MKRWNWISRTLALLALLGLVAGFGGRPVAGRAALAPTAPEAVSAVPDDVFWNNTDLVPGVNDTVRSIKFANGDVYIGGNFTNAGGVPANRVAKWDGERWSALGLGVTGGVAPTVAAIDVSTNFVYVVGDFTAAGGQATAGVARWHRTNGTWEVMATTRVGRFESVAVVEKVGGDDVYVGGTFSQINGSSFNRIAKFRNGVWSALGSGIGGGTAPSVKSISINPASVNQLAVGGLFSTAGGSTANNVAVWSGTAWSSMGTGTSNGVNGQVNVVQMTGANFVTVGGGFVHAGTTTFVGGFARWTGGNTWIKMAGRGVSGGAVFGFIETSPTELYVAGTFTSVLNDVGVGDGSSFLARFDGNIWHATDARVGASVFSLDRAGSGSDDFFIGGSFQLIGGAAGLRAMSAAFVDTDFGQFPADPLQERFFALGGGPQGSNDSISTLRRSGSTLFVAGVFNRVSQILVQNIALFDTGTRLWRPLGPAGQVQGANLRVRDLILNGSDVIAVGDFTEVGDYGPAGAGKVPAAGVAVFNGATWQALATSIDGDVHAVAIHNNEIVVGGDFTTINGVTVNHVARWNGSAWLPLSGPGGTGTDGSVLALASSGGSLYAGGLFASAGGLAASNIAAWNGSWRALGGGTNGRVVALRPLANGLIAVGGRFLAADGNTNGRNIALVNGATNAWQALGSGVRDEVRAIEQRGNDIYAGGLFTEVNGLTTPAKNIGRWNGLTWQPLASGAGGGCCGVAGGGVNAMVLLSDRLFVGGDFERAGDKPSPLFGEWTQPEVDLQIRPSDSPDPVGVNNALTYTTRVYNTGNLPAASTVVTQSIPASFLLANFTTTQGSCSLQAGNTVRCALGTLADGANATIQIFVTPGQVGTFNSAIGVSSSAVEPITSNNFRTIATTVTPPGNPDPTISSISPSSFVRQPFTFPPPPAVKITVNGTGFVPTSKVHIDGAEAGTTFISNSQLQFSKAATSNTGTYDITVVNPAPGGGTSNVAELRVTFGLVGVSSVTPNSGGADPGLQTTFVVSWTHTTDQWRVIDHMDLRLVDADGAGIWLRFTEGLSGTFSLLDAEGVPVGVAETGADQVLDNEVAELDVAASSFAGSGPAGFSMEARFVIRFKEAARGKRYNIELYATDDNGDVQGPDVMGEFKVGFKNVYLPLMIR